VEDILYYNEKKLKTSQHEIYMNKFPYKRISRILSKMIAAELEQTQPQPQALQPFNIISTLYNASRAGTQDQIILNIFKKREYGTKIAKRLIEKEFGLTLALQNVDIANITCLEDILAQAENLPGDLQRQLRTFHDKYHKYGLDREGTGDNIRYFWNDISRDEYDYNRGVVVAARNIFKDNTTKQAFIDAHNNQCEICEGKTRLAVDHWRAHSVYGVDSPQIAVLLCETCNNIHHNYDASRIIKKHKHNIQYIKNWIKIEKRIRDNGFMPTNSDADDQNKAIDQVNFEFAANTGAPFQELLDMKIEFEIVLPLDTAVLCDSASSSVEESETDALGDLPLDSTSSSVEEPKTEFLKETPCDDLDALAVLLKEMHLYDVERKITEPLEKEAPVENM
jgi:hypothetical protein